MMGRIIDEEADQQMRPLQQAYIRGGAIMNNMYPLHEELRFRSNQALPIFLLLDCSKGFNLASHRWLMRILDQCKLDLVLISLVRLLISR